MGIASALAVCVVRRGSGTACRRAPGKGPRSVRIGTGGRMAAIMMDYSRATSGRRRHGRGRRRELEHGGR